MTKAEKSGCRGRVWRRPVAGALLGLGLLAAPAQALVVTLDMGWGYNYGGAGTSVDLAAAYNLQVGSLVQVIMFNSSDAGPGTTAAGNFEFYSTPYTGDPMAAEPYSSGSQHEPTDTTTYKPDTTPDGHVIVAEFGIEQAPYADGQGDTWYRVLEQFHVVGDYDRLYVRIFGATEFPPMVVVASYWGLSEVQNYPGTPGVWYVGPGVIDDLAATNKNYFEVIPEPGSLALLALGTVGLWAGRRRRHEIPH